MTETLVASRAGGIKIETGGRMAVYTSINRRPVPINEHDLAILKYFADPRSVDRENLVAATGCAESVARVEKLKEAGLLVSFGDGEATALAEGGFGGVADHHWMLRDYTRVAAYRSAIFRHANAKDVLEIGCGTGILSIFAHQAGAKSVTAIEESAISRLAEQMFAANNAPVTLLKGNSLDVRLEEKADLLIHEIIGLDPFGEDILKYIADAKERLVKPTGRLLPGKLEVWAIGIEAEFVPSVLDRVRCEAAQFDGMYQVEFGPYRRLLDGVTHLETRGVVPRRGGDFRESFFPSPLLTEETRLLTVDLNADPRTWVPAPVTVDLRAAHAGRLGSLILYCKAYLDDDHVLTSSPFTPRTSWGWQIRDLVRIRSVNAGDIVPLRVEISEKDGRASTRITDLD